jgi:hypothetical protein
MLSYFLILVFVGTLRIRGVIPRSIEPFRSRRNWRRDLDSAWIEYSAMRKRLLDKLDRLNSSSKLIWLVQMVMQKEVDGLLESMNKIQPYSGWFFRDDITNPSSRLEW